MKWADSRFQAQLGPRRWIGLLKHQGTGEIWKDSLERYNIILYCGGQARFAVY